ncbi:sdk-P1, putative [Ixodes scapularis]|uniref:Sdk-P1, putative n=1 Tax=Ixodes scapularis TaxID=6945 RepID=B7PEB1_IXOSC|nr:sdk-P1, putative [Ixodes scapularis]|eukprot:XP_002400783.1 sdk-P1, putative [Ixodes scapularis]
MHSHILRSNRIQPRDFVEHQWAPRFVKHPEGGYVSLGQRRGLHCDAVGSPAPRLRLLRDGQPLTNWTGTTRLLHVLSHVELSHAGLYQCVANNSAGSVLSRTAKLRVAHLTASEPVSKTVTVQVRRGSPVVLDPPRAESVPAATATWMRLSGDASGSEPLEGIQYATTQDNHLVILEARFEDQGRYQVELTNPHTGEFLLGPLLELEVEGESVEEDGPHKLSIVVPPSESEFNNLGNGYDNTLECIAAGSPLEEVRVSWLKGGQPLRGLPHALTHWNRTLTLLNRLSEGPNYGGSLLWVAVPPRLVQAVSEETAAELGQHLQLPCLAEGRPPPAVEWLRNARPLDVAAGGRLHVLSNGSLDIDALSMEDAGVLQCVAHNPLGEARAATWLHVKISPPAFLRPPENVTVLDGMDAQLPCAVVGAPLPNTSWAYNDLHPVLNEGRTQILDSGTLVIASVVTGDSGKYSCTRANSAGATQAEAYLTVLVRTQIVKPPVDTRVILGSTAELQCRISHDPSVPYEVCWFFGEQQLGALSRVRLSPDGTLRIDQARNTDIGTYTCMVTSPGGNDTRSARLEVIVAAPLEGERNGRLLGYAVEYRLAGYPSSPWAGVNVTATRATLEDLIVWQTYALRVAAFNEKGLGVFSEPIHVRTREGVPQAAPSGLRADALNSTAVQVRWRPPDPQLVNGLNQGYRVEAWPRGSAVGVGSPEASLVVAPLGGAPLQEHAAVVAGLRKYHSYNLTVLCFTSPGNGPRSAPVLVTTKQDVPGPVGSLKFDDILDVSVKVLWTPPEDTNGILLGREGWSGGGKTSAPDARTLSVSPLVPFTEYRLRLLATNVVGPSPPSEPSQWFQTIQAPPAHPPRNVTVRAVNAHALRVRWTPLPQVDWYGVPRGYNVSFRTSDEGDFRWTVVEDHNANSLVLDDLQAFTPYEVFMQAFNDVGTSGPSDTSKERTREAVPSAGPSQVSAKATSSTTVVVTWGPVPRAHRGGILEGYRVVYRAAKEAEPTRKHIESNATFTTTLTELRKHTSYTVQVLALTRVGDGALSLPPVTVTTFEDVLTPLCLLSQPQSYYAFAVSARTKEGWGLEARALVLTTASREKPQAPSRPLVSPSQVQARHLTLSWTPGRDGFAPLRCYLLQKIEAGGPWKELPQKIDPGATTYTVADLRPATRYLFRLRAVNDLGFSPWSEESNETWTLPAAPEVAPTGVVVTPYTTTSITVVWKGIAEEAWNGDLAHPSYRVEACPVGAGPQECRSRSLEGAGGGPLTLEGLQRDRIYEVRVVATNGQGDGPTSRPVSVYVGEAVPTGYPRQVRLDAPSPTEVAVSWAPPPEDERNGELLGYKIFYKAEGDAEEAMEAVPATPAAYTLTDLRRFTRYSVQLLAFNPAGDGPRSQALQVQTLADRPGVPGPLDFSDITMNSLNVSWSPPEEPNGVITGYLVNYETADLDIESGRQVRQKVSHTFLAVRALCEMTTYRFSVQAETSQGYGPESQRNVTTGPQEGSPLAPLELALQRNAGGATLSWKEGPQGSAPITGYLLEARPSHSGKLFLEYKQRMPFYREPWFLVVLAAGSMVAIILVVAVLCVKSKTHRYKQEMQQSLQSEDHLSLEDAGFGSPEPSVGAKRSLTRASLRKPLRSPPRPSPASVTYSDEDDTKGYDDHCDSSSLTEKPSEMSSSDSQGSESESDTKGDPHSFVNHYANVNDTLRQSWKRQRVAKPPSYTDSEQDSATAMCLNGGRVVLHNMAGSRAPLPGFSSFV